MKNIGTFKNFALGLTLSSFAALNLSACRNQVNAPVVDTGSVRQSQDGMVDVRAQDGSVVLRVSEMPSAVSGQNGDDASLNRSLLWDNGRQGAQSPGAPRWPAPGSGLIQCLDGTRFAVKRGQVGPAWSPTGEVRFSINTKNLPYSTVTVEVDGSGKELLVWRPGGPSLRTSVQWITPDHTSVFRLYSPTGILLDTVTVVSYEYKVGVNYYSTNTNDLSSAFLTDYHKPEVRSLVQTQLKHMADNGASVILTPVWPAVAKGDPAPTQKYLWHFPPTLQELANLRLYAQDVANTYAADGHQLTLNLSVLRLWGASTRVGTPSTTVGYEKLSPEDFISRMKTTHNTLIDTIYDIKHPNGKSAIGIFYGDGCVQVGHPALPHEGWFLKNVYPDFVARCRTRGITPSLYFTSPFGELTEGEVMSNAYVDPEYPILNRHRSARTIYRTLKFMVDNQLPMPSRIDFAVYNFGSALTAPGPMFNPYPYSTLVARLFDDIDATLPTLGAPSLYGVAEAHYPGQDWNRREFGKAISTETLRRGRLVETTFWPTFEGKQPGATTLPPYVFGDFYNKTR